MKDKTADDLTQVQTETSECGPVFFNTRDLQLKQKELVLPNNVLDKSVKIIKFLKS